MSKIYRPVIPIWIEEEDMRLVEVVRSDCNGCKFVGTYDTEFPCAICARKTKDYYEPQTERSE